MRAPPLLVILALLLAGCAANQDASPGDGDSSPDANSTTQDGAMAEPEAIQVTVGEGGAGVPPALYTLAPATLELTAGKAYNLTLKNAGRIGHDLVIEGLDVAIPTTAAGQTSEGVVFTPAAPGTFAMYCTIGAGSPTAHKDHGMAGEVVVS